MLVNVTLVMYPDSKKNLTYGMPFITVKEPMAIFPLQMKYWGYSLVDWTTNNTVVDNYIKSLKPERGICRGRNFVSVISLYFCPIRYLDPVWEELTRHGLMGLTIDSLVSQWQCIKNGTWIIHNISDIYKCNAVNPIYVMDSVKIDVGNIE